MRRRWARLRRRRTEAGYAAILVAVLVPVVFIGCSAIAVDTGRWYLEMQRVQAAADAAALAGVPYLPQDLPDAKTRALAVAARNGYDSTSPNVTVTVGLGDLASQLKVTISSKLTNVFGAMIGSKYTTITQSATADYTGPAPMGSPCNTFGNEPSAGAGTQSPRPSGTALGAAKFANCSSNPQFWATVEGPETTKTQGDRYQTLKCASGNDGCSGTTNTEYDPLGYFFLVKVQPAAVNTPVTVQLYDPEYAKTGTDCASLPAASSFVNNMNDYVTTDGKDRYSKGNTPTSTGTSYCTGDNDPDGKTSLMTTSFVLREQTDSQNPMQGAPITGCTKQFTGQTGAPVVKDLQSSSTTYDDQLAQVFHNWMSLCTFTPTRDGDYYLQVRTDVSAGGTSSTNTKGNPKIIYSGNAAAAAASANTTTGSGDNSFGIRAVTNTGLEESVAVSGYNHMPIFANADSATSTFNLIRVLPGAAGQYVSFSFFDVGDAANSGTVTVVPPADATGSVRSTPFPGSCKAVGGAARTGTTLSNCSAPISNSTNNGKTETMTIPIPSDYSCNYDSLGGCWYRVTVNFSGGSVHDVTTWDATIIGDPVRLIQ